MTRAVGKTVDLYRMVLPKHICPYGLKAKYLLERQGVQFTDHHLTSREQTDAFKAEHGVKTTPQTFIDGRRIGGYDDLRVHFGIDDPNASKLSYWPVLVIFAVAFLMAQAVSFAAYGSLFTLRSFEWFIAISMCILAVQKLRDIERFSTMFLHYDLLGRQWVPYGYIYPFAEALAGILMVAGALTWLSAPIALFIGGVGAYSVYKAVYVEQRELKCACVGGDTNVPLGFLSLTENIMMIAMGLWMPFKAYVLGI